MAPKSLWLSLPSLAERLRGATSLHVACDFDGTLAPIVDHPDLARMPSRTRAALAALLEVPMASLAVLSARRLMDLEGRTGLERVFMTGSAGLEMRSPDGETVVHVAPDQALPAGLREDMAEWCTRFSGAWLDDKGPTFALHYRSVPFDRQPAFCAGVRRRMRPWAGRAYLVPNKKVFEILPPPGWNQAAAVRQWLTGQHDGLLFFFGDDVADDPVHLLTRERQGVAVAVGNPNSRAEYLLPTTEDVVWVLEWLGREWAIKKNREDTSGAL